MRNALSSYSRHYVEVEVRRRRLSLARSFRPAANSADCHEVHVISRVRLAGDWFRPGTCRLLVLPLSVLPCLASCKYLAFFLNLHSFARHAQLHYCTPLTSPHTSSTLSSISLFTSLRLGLGRFTRFPTRLPAYHCQYFHYHFPPASKTHESRSRAPWPYISPTKMSSSEDDKPLVKGLFAPTCTRLPHQETLS